MRVQKFRRYILTTSIRIKKITKLLDMYMHVSLSCLKRICVKKRLTTRHIACRFIIVLFSKHISDNSGCFIMTWHSILLRFDQYVPTNYGHF